MLHYETDTLIIGAGLIGSSVAMHLAKLGESRVRVIDLDLEGSHSSSELNAGGVRATWNQALNIGISQLSIEYFASVASEVGYRACGYLWLHSADKLPSALKARELQRSLGWEVDAWDVAELQRRAPFIDKVNGIAGATFAPRDGLLNSNLLKNHYRTKAREKGVAFDDKTICRSVEYTASGITVRAERLKALLPHEAKSALLEGTFTPGEVGAPQSPVEYRAKRVINCVGPWAPDVAKILGYSCSSQPVRRQVCIFDCREVDLTPYGMIVDTTGVYFHPEAANGLAGFAQDSEKPGVNFQYDGEEFFNGVIWPALYERSTKFEKLKHVTGWAGLYEVSPDHSAIFGKVEQGEAGKSRRVFEAHSFSGHGVMQSYAAGLALAEEIVLGENKTFDARPFRGSRFEKGQLIQENQVI